MSIHLYYFFLVIISVLSLVALNLLFQSRKSKNLPPGPPYLPIVGNLHQLKQPLHRCLYELSQKYGKVFSLWFGSRLVVVVSSQTAAQECFSKNDIVLANRPYFLVGKYIAYNYTTLVSSPYGDHWRNLRRIVATEVLSTHRLDSFLEIRRDEILRLVQKLALKASTNDDDFARVELSSMFSEMAYNTIMRMVSGKRYYGDDCDVTDVEEAKLFREIIKELMVLAAADNPGDFIALLRWFRLDDLEKRLKRISKRTDSFLQGLVDEHRSSMRNTNTMIDHLLTLQHSHPEYYTDQIIKGLILAMMVAGTETSAITIEWALSNLLNHPQVLEKARMELDTHVGQDRLLEEDDLTKLTYLHNIISETLRLYPAAPMLLPHLSAQDCTLGGYHVPRNTLVFVNAWAIHRDPDLWAQSSTFMPQRFENADANNNPYGFMPFGMGRRACPGSGLAQRTLGLTLGSLIQCFDWKRIGEEEVDMTEGHGTLMSKAIPLEAQCKARPIITKIFSQ
ncbi:hypothetical protein Ahy_Scaffold1g106952 isoform J [Arachis hypogaea]|uniref:Cytochrome P450 n=1 Tax=Arachis hypogaea TaxID=3818 RepID=A0A444WTQ9_ARAHY|nr:hypothetical protein Ahy_Scaffold1g106952 isoform J [Arachis hypogaea]